MIRIPRLVDAKFRLTWHRALRTNTVGQIALWSLVVLILTGLGRVLPTTVGWLFEVTSDIVLTTVFIFCIRLTCSWFVRHVLWKVRYQLAMTYVLVGLAPLGLLASLILIVAYLFSGQFAAFATLGNVNTELAQLAAQNRVFLADSANSIEFGPRTPASPRLTEDTPDWHEEHSDLNIAVYEDGKPVNPPSSRARPDGLADFPTWAHDDYRSIVMNDRKLYLCVIAEQTVGKHRVTVVTSVPFDQAAIDRIAFGLGQVEIWVPESIPLEPRGKAKVKPQTPGWRFHIGHWSLSHSKLAPHPVRLRGASIFGGRLPPPQHFFDPMVEFLTTLPATMWHNGEQVNAAVRVESRPSLLYSRLISSSLMIAAFIQEY